jgi:hypothetical protein
MDFHGNVVERWEKQLVVKANSSKQYFTISKDLLLDHPDGKNMLLQAHLTSQENGKVISENLFYLAPYKDLDFPKHQISYEVKERQDHFQVFIQTQNLAKNIFVSA